MTISLACGSCTDPVLAQTLPFVFYWTLLFAFWALGWGLVGAVLAHRAGVRLGMRPLRYLAAAPLVIVLLGPFTMGSVLAPMLLFLPVWLYRLWSRPLLELPPCSPAGRRAASTVAAVRRITLSLAGLLVPVGYVRNYVQYHPEVIPFREWLLVPEPLAAVGGVVAAWAVVVAWLETRRRARHQPSL
jgi:hypothetical protein